jgi:hypothetical protein
MRFTLILSTSQCRNALHVTIQRSSCWRALKLHGIMSIHLILLSEGVIVVPKQSAVPANVHDQTWSIDGEHGFVHKSVISSSIKSRLSMCINLQVI